MSDKPLEPEQYVDPQLWADDVAAVIDQLELDRPVLVAWSYGGFVVTDHIRAHGEAGIAGVVLVGAAIGLTPGYDHIGPGLLANAQAACGPDLATSIPAIRSFLRACTAQPVSADDFETALCWNMVVPPEVRAALFAREIAADDVIARLAVPMLVAHGRRDEIVLPSMAERALELNNAATASWYDEVGHMPFLEDPVRFNDELSTFVRRATAG
jgi:pimeloyl-ACP methyl ester carboxylesterase